MKRAYLITLMALLIITQGLYSQKPIKVIEDSVRFGNYYYPGFNVTIPEAGYDKVLKSWTKTLETGTKSKVQTENGEMTIFGARIKEIGAAPVNIYSRLVNEDTLCRLLTAIELKKDQYIETASGDMQLNSTRNFLKEFAKKQYMESVKDDMSGEEKKLRNLKKELSSLEGSKARAQKKAKSKRRAINDEQDKLLVRNNELTILSSEIISKNNEMISMPVGAGREAMTKQIKELEKRRKKLQKQISKGENKISKARSDIQQADRSIPKNEREQDAMQLKIDAQERVVKQYVDKLNTIKQY